MNPIVLIPNSDTGSEVVVMGKREGDLSAREYFRTKAGRIPMLKEAFAELEREYEAIVIEGAGSPVELNLKKDDIVNMGIAKLFDAPVLLAADIDRGGVFAQIYGTIMLLEPEERARMKGVIINKFRGDPALLADGLKQIEELTGVPVLGVLPYLKVDIDEEDSLGENRTRPQFSSEEEKKFYRERQYDILGDAMEEHLDMDRILSLME